MNKSRIVIQIGGTVRSGTTILSLILANSKNAISLGEVMHLFYPYRKIHFQKIEELSKNEIWKKIINDNPKNLYKNIFKFFPKTNIIIDSSKDPAWYKKMLVKYDYEIHQIVTYKSPNDLKNSFLKRNKTNWKKLYINYYRRFFTIFPLAPTVSLKFILNNESYLEQLCSFLKIEFSKKMINYWTKEHPNFFGSPTVKQQKINHNILSNDNKLIISNKKMNYLFKKLSNKQFTFPSHDINFKYNIFILKILYAKDYIIRKIYFRNNF